MGGTARGYCMPVRPEGAQGTHGAHHGHHGTNHVLLNYTCQVLGAAQRPHLVSATASGKLIPAYQGEATQIHIWGQRHSGVGHVGADEELSALDGTLRHIGKVRKMTESSAM